MTDTSERSIQTEPSEPANRPASGKGRFAPGISGNPSGRPKVEGEVRDLARRYTKRASRRLAELIKSPNERVAVVAATALLDRGWGRPAQVLTGAEGAPLNLVVGLMSGPIDDALPASQVYQQILGNPSLDLSTITFAPPAVAPQPADMCAPQPADTAVQPIARVGDPALLRIQRPADRADHGLHAAPGDDCRPGSASDLARHRVTRGRKTTTEDATCHLSSQKRQIARFI
jgi:hypothetical protein